MVHVGVVCDCVGCEYVSLLGFGEMVMCYVVVI